MCVPSLCGSLFEPEQVAGTTSPFHSLTLDPAAGVLSVMAWLRQLLLFEKPERANNTLNIGGFRLSDRPNRRKDIKLLLDAVPPLKIIHAIRNTLFKFKERMSFKIPLFNGGGIKPETRVGFLPPGPKFFDHPSLGRDRGVASVWRNLDAERYTATRINVYLQVWKLCVLVWTWLGRERDCETVVWVGVLLPDRLTLRFRTLAIASCRKHQSCCQ
jgi:hypothetical protein